MRRPRLTYANVLSTLCLFLVLGGGAWAATKLPKNSVGTPQLKANAVTGAKVKNGSLTGADVQASTLGKVPQATSAESATNASHATSADSAGHANGAGTADHATSATSADHATSADTAGRAEDADALDGTPASAFVLRSDLRPIAYEAHWEADGGAPRPLITVGPLALSAVCFDSELGGTHTYFELIATGAAGSTVDYSLMLSGGGVKVGSDLLEPSAPNQVGEKVYSENPGSVHASETLVYRDASRTISIPLAIFVAGDTDVCRVSGSATVAE